VTTTAINIETEINEAQENVAARARAVEDAKAALDRATSRTFTPASVVKRAQESLEDATTEHAAALELLHAAVQHQSNEQAAKARADQAKKTAARAKAANAKLDAALAALDAVATEAAEVVASVNSFRVPSHVAAPHFAPEWQRENVDASRLFWIANEGRPLIESLRSGKPFARRRRLTHDR
jgi:hypothetical protein